MAPPRLLQERLGASTATVAARMRRLLAAAASRHSSSSSQHVRRRHAAAAAAGSTASQQQPPACLEGQPLDACIGPPGCALQLMQQEYSVAGRLMRLVMPLDVDAVLDMYIQAGTDGDPYWARVWPSALALAQQLLQRPGLVAGKKVGDLGAGLGVAGLAAALAGAREVVLLDREPLALQCALLSAAASGVAGVQQLPGGGGGSADTAAATGQQQQHVPSAELLQLSQLYLRQRAAQQQEQQQQQQGAMSGTPGAAATAAGGTHAPPPPPPPPQQLLQLLQQPQPTPAASCVFRACAFDWSSASEPEAFDVVLACDVLYEAEAVQPVADVVRRLLARSSSSRGGSRQGSSSSVSGDDGGLLLLADPPNRTAANRQRFVELLASGGSSGTSSSSQRGPRLLLEEAGVYACNARQLDGEMRGGVADGGHIDVAFLAFRAAAGNDTIGVKL